MKHFRTLWGYSGKNDIYKLRIYFNHPQQVSGGDKDRSFLVLRP